MQSKEMYSSVYEASGVFSQKLYTRSTPKRRLIRGVVDLQLPPIVFQLRIIAARSGATFRPVFRLSIHNTARFTPGFSSDVHPR